MEKEDAGVREIHHKIEFTREVRKTKMRLGHLLTSTPAPVRKGMENEHHQKKFATGAVVCNRHHHENEGDEEKKTQAKKKTQKETELTQVIQLLLDALDVLLRAVRGLDGGTVAGVDVVHGLTRGGSACTGSAKGLVCDEIENRAVRSLYERRGTYWWPRCARRWR